MIKGVHTIIRGCLKNIFLLINIYIYYIISYFYPFIILYKYQNVREKIVVINHFKVLSIIIVVYFGATCVKR